MTTTTQTNSVIILYIYSNTKLKGIIAPFTKILRSDISLAHQTADTHFITMLKHHRSGGYPIRISRRMRLIFRRALKKTTVMFTHTGPESQPHSITTCLTSEHINSSDRNLRLRYMYKYTALAIFRRPSFDLSILG